MKGKIYGYELILNLHQCEKETLTSKKKLKEYVDSLCKVINMKKYGNTIIAYFGEKMAYTKGFSLLQLIETSSITGHFSDLWKTAYINIFSCRKFDSKKARKFTKEFFGAKKLSSRFTIR